MLSRNHSTARAEPRPPAPPLLTVPRPLSLSRSCDHLPAPAPPTAPPPAQSRMSDIVNDKVIKIMSLVSKLTKSFSGMEKATQNPETEGQERFCVEPVGSRGDRPPESPKASHPATGLLHPLPP